MPEALAKIQAQYHNSMKNLMIPALVVVTAFTLFSFKSNDLSDTKESKLEQVKSYKNLVTAAKDIFTRDEKTFSDKFTTRRATFTPTTTLTAQSDVINNY